LHMQHDPGDAAIEDAHRRLLATRPTAVNLRWALERMVSVARPLAQDRRAAALLQEARAICDEDVAMNEAIGEHGLGVLRQRHAQLAAGTTLQVLTHCNAGWLATVDWGT